MAERARFQKPNFPNPIKDSMMHEVPWNIKQLQLSIVSIEIFGTDEV